LAKIYYFEEKPENGVALFTSYFRLKEFLLQFLPETDENNNKTDD